MFQPYDRMMKSIAAADPEALYLLVNRPPPPGAVIQPLVQEIEVSLTPLDYWYQVTAGNESWVDIFEFKSRYESGMKQQILNYGLRAHLSKGLPVRCTTIVMTPHGFPASFEELEPIERKGLISVRFETVKVWELNAGIALGSGKPRMLSLVPFMRSNQDELAEAGRRLLAPGLDEARAWFWKAARLEV